MSLPIIDIPRAKRLLDEGAVLIDIREADEHARERVPGARHNPLSRLAPIETRHAKTVIFHCRSGARLRPPLRQDVDDLSRPRARQNS